MRSSTCAGSMTPCHCRTKQGRTTLYTRHPQGPGPFSICRTCQPDSIFESIIPCTYFAEPRNDTVSVDLHTQNNRLQSAWAYLQRHNGKELLVSNRQQLRLVAMICLRPQISLSTFSRKSLAGSCLGSVQLLLSCSREANNATRKMLFTSICTSEAFENRAISCRGPTRGVRCIKLSFSTCSYFPPHRHNEGSGKALQQHADTNPSRGIRNRSVAGCLVWLVPSIFTLSWQKLSVLAFKTYDRFCVVAPHPVEYPAIALLRFRKRVSNMRPKIGKRVFPILANHCPGYGKFDSAVVRIVPKPQQAPYNSTAISIPVYKGLQRCQVVKC
jgi:hypothetical protein